jgi:hypothetical protein
MGRAEKIGVRVDGTKARRLSKLSLKHMYWILDIYFSTGQSYAYSCFRAPVLWWLKVISKPGCVNILTVSQERLQNHDSMPQQHIQHTLIASGDMIPSLNAINLNSRSVPHTSHQRSGSRSSVFSTDAASQPHLPSQGLFHYGQQPDLRIAEKRVAGSLACSSSSMSRISSTGSLLDMKPSAVRRANIQALVMDVTDEHGEHDVSLPLCCVYDMAW